MEESQAPIVNKEYLKVYLWFLNKLSKKFSIPIYAKYISGVEVISYADALEKEFQGSKQEGKDKTMQLNAAMADLNTTLVI